MDKNQWIRISERNLASGRKIWVKYILEYIWVHFDKEIIFKKKDNKNVHIDTTATNLF